MSILLLAIPEVKFRKKNDPKSVPIVGERPFSVGEGRQKG